MAKRLLSLIMPAYKQEKTITKDVKNLDKVLDSLDIRHEIIIVVDGFIDDTYKKAKRLKSRRIKIIGYEENKGKGFAIKTGVEKAKGEIIGFIDAGMDLDPREISIMLNIMDWKKADIVVGSKLHPDSIVKYPRSRRIISWIGRLIIHSLFDIKIKDTQVGLKLFKGNIAKDVFPRIVVKAFAFDIEVLAVAQKLGYTKIYEAPVKLRFRQGGWSDSKLWRILFFTLWDTLAIFYRMNVLHYYDRK
jgi:glycosyltransferase involved in cell wall biosynthesis